MDLKMKDDQLAQCRDNKNISKLQIENEELRAEIKIHKLALNTDLHKIKTKSTNNTAPAAESKLKNGSSYKKW